MVYILWLICGWQEQKLKNKLWLITLEFDKIGKIAIHFKKEHLIRILYIKKFLKNIHSSGRNQNPKIFHFEHSPRDFYVNLRGWNLILRAMGLIWRVLSDYNIKQNFPTTFLILGFISKWCQCILLKFWYLASNLSKSLNAEYCILTKVYAPVFII